MGKVGKRNKLPNPETAAGIVPRPCTDVALGRPFQGFTARSPYPLTAIVTPFASPPFICRWLPPLPQWAFVVPVSNPEATGCLSFHCLLALFCLFPSLWQRHDKRLCGSVIADFSRTQNRFSLIEVSYPPKGTEGLLTPTRHIQIRSQVVNKRLAFLPVSAPVPEGTLSSYSFCELLLLLNTYGSYLAGRHF